MLLNLYRETLEREDKITMAFSIELRVPYLDPEVVKLAMSIDPKLKVFSEKDNVGKHVHRELAEEEGIPSILTKRPKDAAQHGAGIHDAIAEIAVTKGFSKELAKSIGYKGEISIKEKLGSSHRYGYKYTKTDIWSSPDHIQLYLDTIAWDKGLLPEDEKRVLEPYMRKIAQKRMS